MPWTPEAGWKSQGLLHLTVLIFGFTGILGKWISLDGVTLVWWRVLFAALCLAPFLFKKGVIPARFWKMLGLSMATGLVVGAHWATFFHAIKISNVSVTLASMSATTLVVAFLEPLFFRTKIGWMEPVVGLIIGLGLWMILGVVPQFGAGITVGLISASLSGIFTILNRKLALTGTSGVFIAWAEMIGAWLGLGLCLIWWAPESLYTLPSGMDLFLTFLLGSICTAFTFAVTLKLLTQISAYSVVLAINLEPIYGFVLAAWIFHENQELNWAFYLGSLIILGGILGYGLLKKQES
ncbi:MAG: DMT family transporter [Bacteroidia bacterium]|jgi:drug/metabolite transporter (DMT)-like permease